MSPSFIRASSKMVRMCGENPLDSCHSLGTWAVNSARVTIYCTRLFVIHAGEKSSMCLLGLEDVVGPRSITSRLLLPSQGYLSDDMTQPDQILLTIAMIRLAHS